jgi:hypothetical protein
MPTKTKKPIVNRDNMRAVGFIVGAGFIVWGVFKPVSFSAVGQGTDNALIFSGLIVIALSLVGAQIAKYLSEKIK